MLDEKTLRKKVLLRLLGSPFTMVPFVLGMTLMTASWALNWNPGLGIFAGVAGALGAAGAFFSQMFLKGEQVTREAAADAAREENQAQQRRLDDLDRRLVAADSDTRPETALRELRALIKAFEESEGQDWSANAPTMFDVQAMARQLFEHCVQSLEQTDRLWQTAQKLQSLAARKPILHQRETIIAEVRSSVQQLSSTLVSLQAMGSGSGAGPGSQTDLARLRRELDESLAMARTVEERVNALVQDTAGRPLEPPVQPKTNK